MGWATLFHAHMDITALNATLQQTDPPYERAPASPCRSSYQCVTWVSMGTVFCQEHAVFFFFFALCSPENMSHVSGWIRE